MGKNYIDVEVEVAVRKHEVDAEGLKKILRSHRKPPKIVAEELGVPLTRAEHWFRTDKYFAIPEAEIWLSLKSFLGIQTDEFDRQIMEYEYREGKFDSGNRIYCGNVAPTLTVDCGNHMLLTEKEIDNG